MSLEKLTDSLWKLQIIGWSIYFVLMFLTFLTRASDETLAYIFAIKGYRTLVGFSLSCILWLIYRRIINRKSFGKIISIVFVSSIFCGIIWTTLETFFFYFALTKYDLLNSLQYKPRIALTYTVTLLAWSAIYFGVEYWKQLKSEQRNVLEAKLLAEKAQLEMLRYQVNPHFLFNAMNSIRASIDEDKDRAKLMVTQLSEFLRHSLLNGENKEIPLQSELEAIQNYLAIEKIRFEEDLQIEFDIDEEAKEFKIPGFLLNPLVENAIKHGFQHNNKVLEVTISAKLDDKKLSIQVANSGNLVEKSHSNSTHIGLNNVSERLKKLFPNKSSFKLFEKNGFVLARIEIYT